jgi:NADH:ubiquinone oxidoreductase subunit 5 (subunit L)/multisubunit Na+/H+ antiporter MnhA subunit
MRTLPRRLISALVGGLLLLGTLIEGYFQSFGFYQEHYVWPKEKYGALTPLRWQDIVFLVAFWVIAAALFYLSYRLLRYAFRRESPATG